jgi:predicted choloylglycine hydrolase
VEERRTSVTNFQVGIVQVRGNAYESGLAIGGQVKYSPLVEKMNHVVKEKIAVQEVEAIFQRYSPHLIDEIRGLADALHMPYERAMTLFSGYDLPKVEAMGCTAVITPTYYVRNYDFSPVLYDHLFVLQQVEGAYASGGYSLQVIGRHEGANEHGLAIGFHFVNNAEYLTGISAWTAVRMVLDCCKTTGEAITLLKELPHATCYNFSIGDKLGHMAIVKATPYEVNVQQDVSYVACVNHFLEDIMAKYNRTNLTNSSDRYMYLQSLKENHMQGLDVYELFKDVASPLFFEQYEQLFGTLHTFYYDFAKGEIVTSVARGTKDVRITMKDWVAGKDITERVMIGVIKSILIDKELRVDSSD